MCLAEKKREKKSNLVKKFARLTLATEDRGVIHLGHRVRRPVRHLLALALLAAEELLLLLMLLLLLLELIGLACGPEVGRRDRVNGSPVIVEAPSVR